MLVVRRDLGARGQPGLADEHDQLVGQADERLAAHALGRDRPLLAQLAHERVGRALAQVDRAAGAERPAPGPRRQPGGAAAGEPAALGVAHDAQRGDDCRRVALDEAQRPAHRLELEQQAAVALGAWSTRRAATPSWLGEPRSRRAAIASSAASTSWRLGLEGLVAPDGADLVGCPGAAGEERGCRRLRHPRTRYARRPLERSPADVYAEHCRRHELAYQLDAQGRPVFRPRVGHAGWRVSAGRGTVYATTVVRDRGRPARNVVLVDLDEGFRMMSTVIGTAPDAVRIGMRVRLAWRAAAGEDDDPPVPVFEVDD